MKRAFVYVVIIAAVCLCGCRPDSHVLVASKGLLDLRESGLESGAVVELKGEWGFFWDSFIISNPSAYTADKASGYQPVPGYWKPYSRGNAVYSLRILLPDEVPDVLGLKLTNVLENYKLYVDGVPVYRTGKPAPNPQTSVPESSPALIPVLHKGGSMDIVIQVTNWNDIRGGLNRRIFFGEFQKVKSLRERHLVLNAVLFGAVLVLGIYHIAIFLFYKNRLRYSYLFLGLICILIALFTGCKDELLLKTAFPAFSSVLRSRINYSALILSVPLFFCYLYFIFNGLFNKKIFRMVLFVSLSAWTVILTTDASFYSSLLVPLEIFCIAVTVYTVFLLARNRFKGEKSSTAFLGGYFILLAGEAAGMLDNLGYIPSISPHLVFLVFVVYQAVLQAESVAGAFRKIQNLNNAYMEMEKESEKFYDLSYIDPLTNLSNRRYLDEYAARLWDRNRLTEAAVSIMIIDIDYFKNYNDNYGHQKGDECLRNVSAALKNSLTRRDDFIARFGGEEFVAIVNCSDDELQRLAQRLVDSVRELGIEHSYSECSAVVTVSAGYASRVPASGESWYALFNSADKALYEAKRLGRNRVFSV